LGGGGKFYSTRSGRRGGVGEKGEEEVCSKEGNRKVYPEYVGERWASIKGAKCKV